MSDNGSQLFGYDFADIAEIDFVMMPHVGDVEGEPFGLNERMHGLNGLRLIVIRADVHALHAQPFVVAEELNFAEIPALFGRSFVLSPFDVFCCHEIGQPYERVPFEALFMGMINAVNAFLSPESL